MESDPPDEDEIPFETRMRENRDSGCDRVIQLWRTPMPAPNIHELCSSFTKLHSPPGTSGSSDRSE